MGKRNVVVEDTIFNGSILSVLGIIFGGPGVGTLAALGTAIFAKKQAIDADEMEYRREHSYITHTFEEMQEEREAQQKAAAEIRVIMEDASIMKTSYEYRHGMSPEEVYVIIKGPDICRSLYKNSPGSVYYHKNFDVRAIGRKDCVCYGDTRDYLDRLTKDIEEYGEHSIIKYKLKGYHDGRWMYSVDNEKTYVVCC